MGCNIRWSQFLSSSGQLLVSTEAPTFSGLITASSAFTRALLIVSNVQLMEPGECITEDDPCRCGARLLLDSISWVYCSRKFILASCEGNESFFLAPMKSFVRANQPKLFRAGTKLTAHNVFVRMDQQPQSSCSEWNIDRGKIGSSSWSLDSTLFCRHRFELATRRQFLSKSHQSPTRRHTFWGRSTISESPSPHQQRLRVHLY